MAARAIALSPEACASRRSATCLARLETLHPNSVWDRIQTLWTEPDSVFVTGLYALLLVRPVDAGGLADYGAKLAAGMPRADVVRTLARSVEARRRKTDVAWLPRLHTLPGGRGRLFSLRILRVVLRRLAAVRPSALLARVRRGHRDESLPRPCFRAIPSMKIVVLNGQVPFVRGGAEHLEESLARRCATAAIRSPPSASRSSGPPPASFWTTCWPVGC